MTSNLQCRSDADDLPQELIELLAALPANVDRKTGAKLVTQYLYPASHRSLERWPLAWRRVNGRAVTCTAGLFRYAYTQLMAAPEIMGGRKAA